MSKDLWFAEMVRLESELLDEGCDPVDAYRIASERAHGSMMDRLADKADMLRKRAREEGK